MSGDPLAEMEDRARRVLAVENSDEFMSSSGLSPWADDVLALVEIAKAARIAHDYLTDSPAMAGKTAEVRLRAAVPHLGAALARLESGATEEQA